MTTSRRAVRGAASHARDLLGLAGEPRLNELPSQFGLAQVVGLLREEDLALQADVKGHLAQQSELGAGRRIYACWMTAEERNRLEPGAVREPAGRDACIA